MPKILHSDLVIVIVMVSYADTKDFGGAVKSRRRIFFIDINNELMNDSQGCFRAGVLIIFCSKTITL